MSRQRPSSAGMVQDFACSGAGSHDQGDHEYQRNYAHSSEPWCETIRPGARSALPMSCCSSSASRFRPVRYAKYMPKCPRGQPRGYQRWSTFVRNHASAILACDFCVVVTATFRLLYVLIVIEHQTRRIVHCNVTTHPTAAWTLQQLREAIPSDHGYRFLIHGRDGIFSPQLDHK